MIDGWMVRSYAAAVGMLAFFPWLRLRAPIHAGEFELIPYVRDAYKGPCAETIDLVTAPYYEAPNAPIAEAVLLGIAGVSLGADLGERLEGTFLFSEMVALAGLARRKFFHHSGYSNRDNYRLAVQSFDEPGKGTLERHRRRDGVNSVYVMAEVHRVRCPGHVQPERVELDVALLEALVSVRGDADAANFVDSMLTYNLANTDSATMSPHVELVLLSGALEKVLGCRSGKEDDLARAFEAAFTPRAKISRADCPRVQASSKFAKSATVRDVWIRDLFVLRGALAHGTVAPQYPSIWTIREHLLLASFVFPLVMKTQLAKIGRYQFSEDDQTAMNAFERLVCAKDLFNGGDDRQTGFAWNGILASVAEEEIRRRVIADLEALDRAE